MEPSWINTLLINQFEARPHVPSHSLGLYLALCGRAWFRLIFLTVCQLIFLSSLFLSLISFHRTWGSHVNTLLKESYFPFYEVNHIFIVAFTRSSLLTDWKTWAVREASCFEDLHFPHEFGRGDSQQPRE